MSTRLSDPFVFARAYYLERGCNYLFSVTKESIGLQFIVETGSSIWKINPNLKKTKFSKTYFFYFSSSFKLSQFKIGIHSPQRQRHLLFLSIHFPLRHWLFSAFKIRKSNASLSYLTPRWFFVRFQLLWSGVNRCGGGGGGWSRVGKDFCRHRKGRD